MLVYRWSGKRITFQQDNDPKQSSELSQKKKDKILEIMT